MATTKKTTTAGKKTTTAGKKTTTVSTGISVSGNKKIASLQKEFNKKFPYLQLCIFYSYAREQLKRGESISQIDGEKTLASVRRADSGGTISIAGNKRIGTLEKEFDTVFGLYAQVCYYKADGCGYYTSGAADSMTLAAFNAKCESDGCLKNKWR